MADETVREIVRRVRTTLQEKGPAGAFLLAELDGAISRGVDLTGHGIKVGREFQRRRLQVGEVPTKPNCWRCCLAFSRRTW
jgi:hypothetical protein